MLVMMMLVSAGTTRADAQRADRSGLWGGLGLGLGSARSTCSVCAGRATGPAAQVRVGGTISPTVLVGVQASGWFKNAEADDRSNLMLTALVTLYPWRDKGLYLEGGIGAYRYIEADTTEELMTQGLALHIGVGFDVHIGRGLSLSPFAAVVASGSGNPTLHDKASGSRLPLLSDMSVRFSQFGVAATLH